MYLFIVMLGGSPGAAPTHGNAPIACVISPIRARSYPSRQNSACGVAWDCPSLSLGIAVSERHEILPKRVRPHDVTIGHATFDIDFLENG
jgi:hypothetical protein